MSPDTVLVLGATSDIGHAIAEAYASRGSTVVLAGRDVARLSTMAEQLRAQYRVDVRDVVFDVLDAPNTGVLNAIGTLPHTAICVVGLSGDQKQAERDRAVADLILRTNLVGPSLLLGEIAQRMEQRGFGTIIAISSVTGERGRAKNYIYGAAKAGLTAFLSGLRSRLNGKGVRVITVKAGWCNTRKSAGHPHPRLLTAEPQQVATAVVTAQQQGRDVIYVLPIWRLIMAAIRLIPEPLFKRMRF